jgi:diguanylate cyclase (GGDEF)-like protein
MDPLGAFVLGLFLAAGVFVPALVAARRRTVERSARATALEQEIGGLRKSQAQLEAEQAFLTQFMRDFPHVARDLFTGLKERQVPGSMLDVIQKSFDPAEAVVLVRRGHGEDREHEGRFVVAAVAPDKGAIRLGTEVPVATGEVGYAALSQLVLSRQDLEAESTTGRIHPGPDALAGFAPEFLAPLVFDQDTLGMLALSRPRKSPGDVKAALRLIAQTGAHALHNAALHTHIRVTAEMDGLTRVFNKKHMEQALSEIVFRTAYAAYDRRDQGGTTTAQTLPVFLFDIDHFKHYNDVNGHLAGDKLLQDLAHFVPQSIRKDDIFGRFGGEEFLLILPNTNLAQALAAANKIRAKVAAHPFAFSAKQPLKALSVSGGVAEYPYHGRDAQSLLHAADEALYEAKQQGRNRVAAATHKAASSPPPARSPGRPTSAPGSGEVRSA